MKFKTVRFQILRKCIFQNTSHIDVNIPHQKIKLDIFHTGSTKQSNIIHIKFEQVSFFT